nr:DNA polymerase III subunit delta' [Gracilibacillus halophilus]
MQSWQEMSDSQPIVSKMLKNHVKKQRVSHAYLFQGDVGTDKEGLAILLAKSIFCNHLNQHEPCQQCKECRRIDSGNHPDLHWIVPDGASIKKDQILHLQKEFTYTGMESNQKVYVIVDAEKMTDNAANRLLKFLEEPTRQTTAILLTENLYSILTTIRSRCQIMSLQPLNPDHLQQNLMEQGLTEANAKLIAQFTQSTQEALEKSNDAWFAQARKLVVQLTEMLLYHPKEVQLFVHTHWMPHFKERRQLQEGLDLLLIWLKDIVNFHVDYREAIIFIQHQERIEKASMQWSLQTVTMAIEFVMEAKRKIEQNVHPQLVMEQLTLQISR